MNHDGKSHRTTAGAFFSVIIRDPTYKLLFEKKRKQPSISIKKIQYRILNPSPKQKEKKEKVFSYHEEKKNTPDITEYPSITGKGIKNSLQHFPVHCKLHRQIVLAYIQHLSVNLLHTAPDEAERNINLV